MARLPYSENQSIKSMNTRQLRQYISDQAQEAQARLDTKPKDATRAFEELLYPITNRERTRIKRSTSNMTKAEMQEYAYDLTRFNKYDVESKYYNKTDFERNKQRYESFIKNQVEKSGEENQYWKKYILPSGNVSKKGYQEYKDFIEVLKASDEFLKSFGYRDIQQYAQDKRSNLDPGNKILNRTIAKVYRDSKGQGLTQAELLKNLKREYDDALNKEASKQKPKAKPKTSRSVKPSTKKGRKTSSKSNIKVKTGKKMKSGSVRNKLS